MKLSKVLGIVLAAGATAAAVKVVSDILEAEKEDNNVIDLDQIAQQQKEEVMVEANKEAE